MNSTTSDNSRIATPAGGLHKSFVIAAQIIQRHRIRHASRAAT